LTAITTNPPISLAQTPYTTLTLTDSILTTASISQTPTDSVLTTSTISQTPTDLVSTISVSSTTSPEETNTADVTWTHRIQVGSQGELKFAPRKLDAKVGDILQFQFLAVNHTLTQSSLQNPCSSNGNFDTKFLHANPTNKTNNILTYLVQNSDPQYFYCAQTIPYSHCNAGMVFALNPGDTFEEFLSNAETSPTSTITGVSSPTGVSGTSMNNSVLQLTVRIPPNSTTTSSGQRHSRASIFGPILVMISIVWGQGQLFK